MLYHYFVGKSSNRDVSTVLGPEETTMYETLSLEFQHGRMHAISTCRTELCATDANVIEMVSSSMSICFSLPPHSRHSQLNAVRSICLPCVRWSRTPQGRWVSTSICWFEVDVRLALVANTWSYWKNGFVWPGVGLRVSNP